jgi:hypothetical protein
MTVKPAAARSSVGYGRPPIESRYTAGFSGNPGGRPKGTKNLLTIINQELSQVVTATVNGKLRRLTKKQVIVIRLIGSAAAGNLRATETVLKYAGGNQADQSADTASGQTSPNEQDKAILERYVARMTTATSGRKDDDNEGL